MLLDAVSMRNIMKTMMPLRLDTDTMKAYSKVEVRLMKDAEMFFDDPKRYVMMLMAKSCSSPLLPRFRECR